MISVVHYIYKMLGYFSRNTKISKTFFLIQIIIFLLLFFLYVVKPQTLCFLPWHHHGNVSAEQISMIDGANFNNGFISPKFKIEGKGDYYPRYSVITNIILHPILSSCKTLSSKIGAIQYVMDLVLFINILLMTYILNKLLKNKIAAFLGSILASTSYVVATYCDLPSPDTFLIFSFLLSFVSIIKFEEKKFIFSLILIISALSFGYLLLNTIPFIFYSLFVVSKKCKLKNKFYLLSFILFLPCVISLLLYSYNVYRETINENIAYNQTSIYESTTRRSGNYPDSYYNTYLKGKIEFYNYYPFYIKNAYRTAIEPFSTIKKEIKKLWRIFLIICAISLVASNVNKEIILENNNKILRINLSKTWLSIKKIFPSNKLHLLITLLLSSCYTLFILKGFVLIHDFGFISLYIMAATIFTFIFTFINKKLLNYIIFPFILVFFATSYNNIYMQLKESRKIGNIYIQDFERIQKNIKNKEDSFMLEDNFNIFPNAIFAIGLYLDHHNIELTKEKSTYYLSKEKRPNTLTPYNKKIFMYKTNE